MIKLFFFIKSIKSNHEAEIKKLYYKHGLKYPQIQKELTNK